VAAVIGGLLARVGQHGVRLADLLEASLVLLLLRVGRVRVTV
jgi:hypothetical protein